MFSTHAVQQTEQDSKLGERGIDFRECKAHLLQVGQAVCEQVLALVGLKRCCCLRVLCRDGGLHARQAQHQSRADELQMLTAVLHASCTNAACM